MKDEQETGCSSMDRLLRDNEGHQHSKSITLH